MEAGEAGYAEGRSREDAERIGWTITRDAKCFHGIRSWGKTRVHCVGGTETELVSNIWQFEERKASEGYDADGFLVHD